MSPIITDLLPNIYWALLFLIAAIWTNVRAYKAGQRDGCNSRAKWDNLRNPDRRHLK